MAKPSALPRWGDVGGDIVEPTSGKKDVGWADNEQPANEYENWLQNLNYQWISWFNDRFDANGLYLHGEVTIEVPFTIVKNDGSGDGSGIATQGVYSSGDLYVASAVDDGILGVKLPLKIGDRLKAVSAIVADNDGGADVVGLSVYKKQLSGAVNTTVSQLGTSQTTTNSANYQTLTVSGLTDTKAAGYTHYVVIDIDNHASCRLYAIYMTYDRVA